MEVVTPSSRACGTVHRRSQTAVIYVVLSPAVVLMFPSACLDQSPEVLWLQTSWRISAFTGSRLVGAYLFSPSLIVKWPPSSCLLCLYIASTIALEMDNMSQWIATMWIFKESSMNKSMPLSWMCVQRTRAVTDNWRRSQDLLNPMYNFWLWFQLHPVKNLGMDVVWAKRCCYFLPFSRISFY